VHTLIFLENRGANKDLYSPKLGVFSGV
jgi:hypothetical protein